MDMTDAIIRAWIAATDEDFGGSLDDECILPRPRKPDKWRPPESGMRYVYRYPRGWHVKIPGIKSKCFKPDELEQAREFVRFHVEGV